MKRHPQRPWSLLFGLKLRLYRSKHQKLLACLRWRIKKRKTNYNCKLWKSNTSQTEWRTFNALIDNSEKVFDWLGHIMLQKQTLFKVSPHQATTYCLPQSLSGRYRYFIIRLSTFFFLFLSSFLLRGWLSLDGLASSSPSGLDTFRTGARFTLLELR